MEAIKAVFKGSLNFVSRLFQDERPDDYLPPPLTNPSRGADFNRFSDLLPYMAWIPDSRLFVLEGSVAHQVDGIGFALELVPQTGASPEMADLLATIFSYMPAGASVQWSMLGSPLIDDFLDSYVDQRMDPEKQTTQAAFDNATMYRELAKRRAAHFSRGAAKPILPNTPYLLRDFRCVMTVIIPATDYEDSELISEIVSLRETCITTLKTYYLFSHEWAPEDMINWCALVLNPHETMLKRNAPHLNYDDGREIKQQIVSPNTLIRVTDSGLEFGLPSRDEICVASAMSIRSYPKTCTLHTMGSLIGDYMQGAVGYSSPFLITLGVITQNFEEVRNATQMKAARATQKADSPMARFMPELQDEKKDWDIAQASFAEGMGTIKLYHQLVLFSRKKDISRAEQSAQAVWRSKQFEIVHDTYMQVQAMLCSLPMSLTKTMQRDIKIAQRQTTKTVHNAVNMAPMLAEWRGAGSPVLPLWGRRGQHMGIDLFSNTTGNFNACVVGTSGSGKSVLLNDMALSYLSIGGRVWVIDVGRSYEKLCHTVGGQYLEFTDEANIRLPPFSMVTNIDDDLEMLIPLFEQMISPSGLLDDYCKAQLGMHIQSVWYEYQNQATVDHLAYSLMNNCEKGGPNPQQVEEGWVEKVRAMSYEERQKICDPRIRDLGIQLLPYTSGGQYGKYFSGESTVNFDSNFIVLELEELNSKKDLQAVVMFLLMYKITQEMYLTRDQKKIVIIDEAWSLLGSGNSAEFIESGYRRARKYGGAFITGTQSLSDYSMSKAAEAALNNADWMFLLRQKPESIMALEKSEKLIIDEYMRDMLMSVKTQAGAFAEVFVHAGQMGHGIGRVILDPFTLLLVSSKAEDFEAVRRHRALGKSIPEAIEAVLNERGIISTFDYTRRLAA